MGINHNYDDFHSDSMLGLTRGRETSEGRLINLERADT